MTIANLSKCLLRFLEFFSKGKSWLHQFISAWKIRILWPCQGRKNVLKITWKQASALWKRNTGQKLEQVTVLPKGTMFIWLVIHLNPFEDIYLSLLTPDLEKKKKTSRTQVPPSSRDAHQGKEWILGLNSEASNHILKMKFIHIVLIQLREYTCTLQHLHSNN